MQKKVLLINPSMMGVYAGTILKNSVPHYPPLNLLVVAGSLKQKNVIVDLLDLDLVQQDKLYETIRDKLNNFQPSMVGVTFTTALFGHCVKIAETIKEFNKEIILVAGGAHASSAPDDLLSKTPYDVAVVGEGDFTLAELIDAPKQKWSEIKGLAYKNDVGKIIKTEKRPFLQNLDETTFPMYELIDIHKYDVPPSFRRKAPVAPIETSRGCVWGCTYCNKSVFGRTFRVKSAERVIEEIKKLIALGYKELHINDDMFTTDKERVKKICKMMLEKNIKIVWACPNGIRADRVDKELIMLMKQAGCYRISFGAESGNQQILDKIHKSQTVAQVEDAFKICKEVGMIAYGFFMFGLPDETEKTMQQTIDFAKRCNPDVAKFGIMIPLPSTPIYEEWKGKYIISDNWDDYSFHKGNVVYKHPTLSQEIINKYYKKAYFDFYLRPGYLIKRGIRSLTNGQIFDDLRLLFSTNWFGK